MVYVDDTFPYEKYKGKGRLFETFAIVEDEDEDYIHIKWQIDYSKELGMYRITKFKDNHWDGDLVFDEVDKNEELP